MSQMNFTICMNKPLTLKIIIDFRNSTKLKELFCSVKNFFTACSRHVDYNFEKYILKEKLDNTFIHLKKD